MNSVMPQELYPKEDFLAFTENGAGFTPQPVRGGEGNRTLTCASDKTRSSGRLSYRSVTVTIVKDTNNQF